jgi:RNA polymerase sigma-70 factor (ECF subfamily)
MATVTPLLIAFYEGQVQAGSITVKDVQGLVQETFVALYQRNTSDDLTLPFRAWLIETARCTQLNYMRSEREKAVGVPLAAAPAFNRDEALSAT